MAPVAAQAQQPDQKVVEHVPQFSILSVRLRPSAMLQTPVFELFPIEVVQAWAEQNLGVDPLAVESIQLVAGMPSGPGAPPLGAVIRLSEEFDPADINKELLLDDEPIEIGGRTVYRFGNLGDQFYLHSVSPQMLLVSTPGIFEPMAAGSDSDGPLAELLRSNDLDDAHLQVIVAVDPIRSMLAAGAAQTAQQLPGEIRDLARVPELLDAVIVEARMGESTVKLSAELVCGDAGRAGELQDILMRSIDFGRSMFVERIKQDVTDDGPIADAQRAYAERLANHVVQKLSPTRKDDRLMLDVDSSFSIASVGVMTALLLPAVQAAREAARRAQASNNLKQIGLAMHNYHSVHGHFPQPAITDDQGNPLLSWRVAILPFIEQEALYEQFNLDEPWDSPHNIQLVEKMPRVFVEPSLNLEPGVTVFQAAVGDELALQPGEETEIRELTDGTSNTILVVEADAASAVTWSAPRDLEIDLEAPLQHMGNAHPGGFQVLMSDGAVRFIARSVDTGLFKALLTRAGGERVGNF